MHLLSGMERGGLGGSSTRRITRLVITQGFCMKKTYESLEDLTIYLFVF